MVRRRAKRSGDGAGVCALGRGYRLAELHAASRPSAGAGAQSGRVYDKTSLTICCPMTTQIKDYPFEVLIAGTSVNVVLADRVKSLDWRSRRAIRKGAVSAGELAEVRAKVVALIG